MTADLSQHAQIEVDGLRVDDLQDDILSMAVDQLAVLHAAGQEFIGGDVQLGQALPAEVVSGGALGCQHQDDVVVRCVHAIEVRKVEVCVGAKEALGGDLEAVTAVRRVLWGLPCVEFGVAAEEDPVQHAAGGRAVAAAVVLQVRLQRVPTMHSGQKGKTVN